MCVFFSPIYICINLIFYVFFRVLSCLAHFTFMVLMDILGLDFFLLVAENSDNRDNNHTKREIKFRVRSI